MKKIVFSNSLEMPVIGLGTWQASNEVVESAVASALDAGYRMIDTAFNYGNEGAIGKVIKNWMETGRKREELFIVTKLPNFGNRADEVEKYLTDSLQRLGLGYVDLYLVHHPFGFLAPPPGKEPPELDMETDHMAIWKAMEEQVLAGRARSIGLSNFNTRQLERIVNFATIKPVNLQVELHAHLQQPALLEVCKNLGVTLTAFSPLGSPHAKPYFKSKYGIELQDELCPLTDPTVLQIAERLNKTPAQILLNYLIQLGIAVVPKSSSVQRIKENFEALSVILSDDDMAAMKTLDKGESGRIFTFLHYLGVEKHPEYPFPLTA